jgi:hypothetical protein
MEHHSMAIDEVDPLADLKAELEHADDISTVKLQNAALVSEATEIYQKVINLGDTSEGAIRLKEKAITRLGKLYARQNQAAAIGAMLTVCARFPCHRLCTPEHGDHRFGGCLAGLASNLCHIPQSKDCEARPRAARRDVKNPG